ncbi:CYTH domain-containing protein [Algibacter aquimarinus]|uniref:CYTH domain-containing protein n=1 Tax=Algibacter aquimarinus TaxID=1136748 RepID=A0ABP9HE68_9FLAO
MIEIERKFLVNSDVYKNEAFKKTRISQGFLNTHKERTVRVRIKDKESFITVKGKSSKDGLKRFEWEKEIPLNEAQELLNICEHSIIDKTRYEVKIGNHIFEVDEFYGENNGLVIAEIELNFEEEVFETPNWLGKEVTGDIKYYNSQLSIQPYKTWK